MQYLLTIYQPDGGTPPRDVLEKVGRELHALNQEIKAKGGLADADPRVATFAIFGIILWLARWHRPDGPLTADAIVDQLTGTALRAVLTPEAIAANRL